MKNMLIIGSKTDNITTTKNSIEITISNIDSAKLIDRMKKIYSQDDMKLFLNGKATAEILPSLRLKCLKSDKYQVGKVFVESTRKKQKETDTINGIKIKWREWSTVIGHLKFKNKKAMVILNRIYTYFSGTELTPIGIILGDDLSFSHGICIR